MRSFLLDNLIGSLNDCMISSVVGGARDVISIINFVIFLSLFLFYLIFDEKNSLIFPIFLRILVFLQLHHR